MRKSTSRMALGVVTFSGIQATSAATQVSLSDRTITHIGGAHLNGGYISSSPLPLSNVEGVQSRIICGLTGLRNQTPRPCMRRFCPLTSLDARWLSVCQVAQAVEDQSFTVSMLWGNDRPKNRKNGNYVRSRSRSYREIRGEKA